ncbi:hypothetical protein OKA06_14680 [Novosphingobium sp. MW5]|nr:hypothetical protein [Novosphingobium sp. MW5]
MALANAFNAAPAKYARKGICADWRAAFNERRNKIAQAERQ